MIPEIIDPAVYAERGVPWEAFARLRVEQPVSRWEPEGMPPFWAITRYTDIEAIERAPETFLNSPLLAIFPKEQFDPDRFPFRAMTKMDPPEHGVYRALTADRFTNRAIAPLAPAIRRIVDARLDLAFERGRVDFVTDVAAPITVFVIAELLGIPPEDREQLFRWTNATMGATDAEFRDGATTAETEERAVREQFEYFSRLVADRRRAPREDLTSVVATATLGGSPLPDFELLSYVIILMIAGNDTTRNAASSGLLALLEHPEALACLRSEPRLGATAVEEMLRFTSPVVQFARTAAKDVDVRGVRIAAGDHVCLFYPSANRDEEVFRAPDEFRIDRRPNPHLAFGAGPHFCLGANLARLELETLFERLLARATSIELAGPVERLRSSFVAGIKHLPVALEAHAGAEGRR